MARVRTAHRKDGSRIVGMYDDRGNYKGDIVVYPDATEIQVIMDDTVKTVITPMMLTDSCVIVCTRRKDNGDCVPDIELEEKALKAVMRDYELLSQDDASEYVHN